MLDIVEQQQRPPSGQGLGDRLHERPLGLLAKLERLRGSDDQERRVANRREWNPDDTIRIAVRCLGRGLQRQPRLAGAAWTGKRQQPRVGMGQPLGDLSELVRAATERRRGDRQVRPMQRPERRKYRRQPLHPQLVQHERRREILQPMRPKLLERERAGLEQRYRRPRQHHLATMRSAHDPRRPVHVHPDVLRRIETWLASVHADPHSDRPAVKPLHQRGHSRNGGLRGCEGIEECVTLVVNLVARVLSACLAHDPSVLGECLPVPLDTELAEQPRGSFDVGEYHRHRPRRLNHRSHLARLSCERARETTPGGAVRGATHPTATRTARSDPRDVQADFDRGEERGMRLALSSLAMPLRGSRPTGAGLQNLCGVVAPRSVGSTPAPLRKPFAASPRGSRHL